MNNMERDPLARTWLTILTVAVVLGFGIVGVLWAQTEGRRAQLQQMADQVKGRLEQLERFASSTRPTVPGQTPTSTADNRPFMPANYFESSPNLPPNFATANQSVEYRNPQIGLQFQVPYNPAWGNAQYKIRPFEERLNATMSLSRIEFGPSGPFEGGGWVRWMSVTIRPASSTQDVVNGLRAEAEREGFVDATRIETISLGEGRQGVVYYRGGLCDVVSVIVIGRARNYEFSVPCGAENTVRQSLLDVARSVRFIDS